MSPDPDLEILLVAPPGLEAVLADEARAKGFADPRAIPGGVLVTGGWPEVWRANLELRGASRVLARVAAFRALHLAQLDKRARKLPWAALLRPDAPVRVEATCRGSRIYHSGAAAQRIARAIAEIVGAPIVLPGAGGAAADAGDEDTPDAAAEIPTPTAAVVVKARIEDDLCTISLDTSGAPLHKRGHKLAVAKAPLRETLAALFLRQCGYDGTEPVVDPMCGAGTFVIEAAEIAAGLAPGRDRRFAFEALASFDAAAWARMRSPDRAERNPGPGAAAGETGTPGSADAPPRLQGPRCFGYDRDAGAIRMAEANAERAGVAARTAFRQQPISDLQPPPADGGAGPPGLVIVNPPYGTRLGDPTSLEPLYRALGRVLRERFGGWRVGLVTSDAGLARATGLPFQPPGPPVPHGGVRVKLYRTGVLG